MRHSRIDPPTLRALGNVSLLFCGIAIAVNAAVTFCVTFVLASACYWWASLEIASDE